MVFLSEEVVHSEEQIDPVWYGEHTFFQVCVDYEKIESKLNEVKLEAVQTWYHTFLFRVLTFQDIIVLEPTQDSSVGYMFVHNCEDGFKFIESMFVAGEQDTEYLAYIKVIAQELASFPSVVWQQAYFRHLRTKQYKFVDDGEQFVMMMDDISGYPCQCYRGHGSITKVDIRYLYNGFHVVYGCNLVGGRCHHPLVGMLQFPQTQEKTRPSKPQSQKLEHPVEVSLVTGVKIRVQELQEFWCDVDEHMDAADIWLRMFGYTDVFLRDVQLLDANGLTPVILPSKKTDRGTLTHLLGSITSKAMLAYFVLVQGVDEYHQPLHIPAGLVAHAWEACARVFNHEIKNIIHEILIQKLCAVHPKCVEVVREINMHIHTTPILFSSAKSMHKDDLANMKDADRTVDKARVQQLTDFTQEVPTNRTIVDEDTIAIQRAFGGIFDGSFAALRKERVQQREAMRGQEDADSLDDDHEIIPLADTTTKEDEELQMKDDKVQSSLYALIQKTVESIPSTCTSEQKLTAVYTVLSDCYKALI